jgi:hypothetical protein
MATNYELWTFQDVLEHVLDVILGTNRSPRNVRSARRAIDNAYREFPNNRQWKYFQRRLRIATVAEQTTGSVAYTHSTRTMTLSDATWPADVVNYSILIDHARYEIESRTSDTVIVLSSDMNPGADLAAGTLYRAFQDTYQLPANFASMGQLQDTVDPMRAFREATLQEMTENNRFYRSGLPTSYTVGKHSRYAGGLAIVLAPAPSTARVYECVYTARPRALRTLLYSTGTATSTADSTAVSGAGCTFIADYVGSVLRLSRNTTEPPTSIIGNYDGIDNPFAFQRIIRSVTDATNLVLEQAADQSLAAVKYTISDPVDLEHGSMFNAFLNLCELKFAEMENRSATEISMRSSRYRQAWLDAAEIDNRGSPPNNPPNYPMSLADWANSVDVQP